MSKLLMVTFVAAVAATGALIVTVLLDMPSGTIPPPPPPGSLPPPPPNMQPLAVFPIVTGFFVLSWLAVLVVFARDQVLRQLRQQHDASTVSREELAGLLADLRAELAGDRERELETLSARFAELTAEFGEQRETDGYLNGMRAATVGDQPEANVRSIRRTPPQR